MSSTAAPVVRWTPAEGWLMVELAKQGLTAVSPGSAEPIRAGVGALGEDLVLEIAGQLGDVTLQLSLEHPSGHRWRDHWILELTRGDERWTLSAETPEVAIAEVTRGPIFVRPRLRHRALARDLAGAATSIPIVDVACHRYTRQSTAEADPEGLTPWMVPTLAEPAPWWELDLAKSLYLAWARIDLVAPPPETRIIVRAYAFLSPTLAPPTESIVFEARADQLAVHAGRVAIAIAPDLVARYLRVELVGADGTAVTLTITAAEVLAAELQADALLSTMRRSFALFRDRPLFITRTGEPIASYGEIWARSQAFARGLAARIEPIVDRPDTPENLRGRAVLVVITRTRIEWLLADLAGLLRGYVTVPLSPDEPDDRLAHVLARAPATCIVCEASDADRMARLAPQAWVIACDRDFEAVELAGREATVPEPVPRAPTELYSVLFTSGSTGAPKGAMRTYATFFAMVGHYQVGHSPRHLSFQPLSHMSERSYLPSLIIHGGCVAFSRGGAHLLEDLKELGPTTLGSVPRLFEVLHAQYRRRLRALIAAEPEASRGELEKRALAEARQAFGPRLSAISIGSAPVTPEVFGFLKRCFSDLWVSEGYGSTEVGTIATDGKIADDVEVKLVPLPDATTEPGRERGEIWVKSSHAIEGYLGDPEATAAAFDAEGYFATGDLGERDGDGRVRVVGRLRNTVKLAQGEFVSAERIETALASCPLVDRIFVHAASGAIGVAALVAPHADALARALGGEGELAALCARPEAAQVVLGAIRAQASTAGLAAYEIPRGVLLEATPFTVAAGLITGNGKLARGTIAQRYGARLAELVAGPLEDSLEAPEDDDLVDLRTRVVRVASRAIRKSLTLEEPLAGAGVDSLAAAEILAALSDELGRDVPLSWWFEARTLGELADRLGRFADTAKPVSLRDRALADLELPPIEAPARDHAKPTHVLLTGATGFLGAHLVEALVARGLAVTCVIRAADEPAARARLDRALADRERAPDLAMVNVIAGDLAAGPRGLDPARLADIDAVVHAGATVSWLASYEALREPNVLGTRMLLELAARHGWAFHHVSTISTVAPDGSEEAMLPFDAALAGTPYGLSKWIAEQHVKRGQVRHTITRPAMIAGHTGTGIGNRDDFTNRYLTGCLELGLYIDRDDAVMDMTPVDFVAAAIAALVLEPARGRTYHLANADQSLSFGAIGRAMVAAGHPVRPASYPEFRGALHRHKQSRLHALAAFFPEGFGLGAGPFPCERSVEELAALGVVRPKIDEALIARYVARLGC